MHVIQRIRTDILVRHSHNHVKCSHKPRACEAAHRLHLLHLHMNSHSRIFAHTQRKPDCLTCHNAPAHGRGLSRGSRATPFVSLVKEGATMCGWPQNQCMYSLIRGVHSFLRQDELVDIVERGVAVGATTKEHE